MDLRNIFLVFTSAHIFHAKNIIETEKLAEYSFVCTDKDLLAELSDTNVVTFLGGHYSLNPLPLRAYKKKINTRRPQVRLFVPHFLNVMAQSLYFYFLKRGQLQQMCIIPDGNLLFNSFTVKRFSYLNITRKIKSLFLLSDYKFIDGDICSVHDGMTYVYSYMSNTRYSSVAGFTVKILDMPASASKIDSGVLVLGHYNQRALNPEKLIRALKPLIISDKEVSYKPHPRLALKYDRFYEHIRRELPATRVITSSVSVERLLETSQGIGVVFAVGSSSLINLKLMNPNLVIYYSAIRQYFGSAFDEVLAENLRSLGIEELPYDDIS